MSALAASLIQNPFIARLICRNVVWSDAWGPGARFPDALLVNGLLTDAIIFYPNDPSEIDRAHQVREAKTRRAK